MSIECSVTHHIVYSGDQELELIYNSGTLEGSTYVQQFQTYAAGDNTISVPGVSPDITDYIVHGLVIVPPAANTVEPVLKGNALDTGIALSANRATVIHFGATPPTVVVLTLPSAINGLRLVWF